ncbi:DUF6801 domain-containing protein [Streptomyces sp. Je 1-369]|uniref:DUF6801 domain-containing protein n=1 Tax=Streptomyces sp. Je 1-369 TaxID=2966192 RepID=UPI002285AC06|nr:DUF6801 domain-containing protein [Streptomyces sp. Je 1-369]WAL99654.1 hypothetical protein NOO62_37410 [Streptomyces sp. Je 1-369]
MTGALSGGRTARLAVAAAVACVAGLLPGSGSAARDQREARLTVTYDCGLPSGDRHVDVAFDATFPGRGAVGKPIRPVGVRVRVSLSRTVVAELMPEGTTSVGGTAAVATTVAQGRERARAEWAELASPEVRLPARGAVEVGFGGDVPQVTVGAEGDVTFTVGRLDLVLDPELRDTGAQPAPAARLSCTPARGADTLLATVPVGADPTGTSPAPGTGSADPDDGTSDGTSSDGTPNDPRSGTPKGIDAGPQPRATTDKCPLDPPKGELDPKRLPSPPPGAEVSKLEPTSMCAVPVGFATLRKLKSSAIVNDPRGSGSGARAGRPGLMHLAMRMREVRAPDYVEYDHLGLMQLPDAEGTFLTFGFQPTTAKVRFEPEPATIVNVIRPGKPPVTRVGYRQHLRLYDVRVNGVPLDVGPRCRTSRPVDTVLTGNYPVSEGGLLQGELDIPALAGCGARGEDFDVLLSGAVSGPGNALRIRQGRVCGAGSPCNVPELPAL